MRRLPVFFVVDVSESMIGEPITDVGAGMQATIQSLRQDPYALETVYVSIIVFAGKAKTLVPLTDICAFYPPQFPVGGGTSLGAAIKHLINELESKLVKNDGVNKGDWKPIIFLFTDGVPTDQTDAAIGEWEAKFKSKVTMIAISVGPNADLSLLRRLTDKVLLIDDTKPETFQEFFKWVTASISTHSQKIDSTAGEDFQLKKLNDDFVRKVNLEKDVPSQQMIDENFVVLNAKCQRTNAPYLIKYKRDPPEDEWAEIISEGYGGRNTGGGFSLAGAFPVPSPAEYQALSVDGSTSRTISAGELFGNPSCPCCGNQFGSATCACGGIHCVHGIGENRCPWCGQTSIYDVGDGDFDISRGLG